MIKIIEYMAYVQGKIYEKDNFSLVLSKVPAGKCSSKYIFRWFVPDPSLIVMVPTPR